MLTYFIVLFNYKSSLQTIQFVPRNNNLNKLIYLNFLKIMFFNQLNKQIIQRLYKYELKFQEYILISFRHIIIKRQKNMMKKYFQIGKDYIAKKIQEYDMTANSKVDYVNQQIPSRLREPLSIIQQGQIDIQGTNAYENYFKGYPNHHISHFLLDKYNMMVEAQADPNSYVVPGNSQYHIPHFDQEFEKKALLLRQAIEQYDQGYTKNDQPIICICVINFHHKRGTQIQYRYPQNKTVTDLEPMIIHHAMPDSSHNKPQDYNFFNFQTFVKGKKRMLFGVSYFKQIKLSEALKNSNPEFTRSYLQKAVAILSTVPLFGYLKVKLCITTKVFFEKFTKFDIIQQAYKQINKHFIDSWPNVPITDLYIGSDLKIILSLFTVNDFYQIWKAILYQKRVVIYAHSSSSASSFLMSLLSLFPGLSTFGIFSKPIAKYMQSLRQIGLPLRLFSSDNFLSLSFHIQDFWQLEKFKKSNKGNFLLATTNRLLKENNDYGIELFVNLQECTIQRRKSRRPWQSLSKKQKKFLSQLEEMVNKQKDVGYGGSQDCIRNHFHNFLKGALIQIAKGIKDFEDFVAKCQKLQETKDQENTEQKKTNQQKSKDSPPLFPQSTKKMILTQLLLNKSFAYFRQFKNDNLPEIVSGKIFPSLYINNYDYFLRIDQQKFISYNWIDKKLTFGKGQNSKNFQGKQLRFKQGKNQQGKDLLKSIFIGRMENGKFNKSGFYFNQSQHYDGEYLNGVKQGYGKLVIGNQKYIGDFHQGLYQGQGQLVIGGDIYVGQFKAGEKNGYGSIQGRMNFEGIWQNNQPKQMKVKIEVQNDKIQQIDKQKQDDPKQQEKQKEEQKIQNQPQKSESNIKQNQQKNLQDGPNQNQVQQVANVSQKQQQKNQQKE